MGIFLEVKPKILCVDDRADNLRIRAMLLEQFGCETITAADHRTAMHAMEENKIDRETMGRLAKALAFIGNPDDPVVVALGQGAETGIDREIKQARTLFLELRQADRRAALASLAGDVE